MKKLFENIGGNKFKLLTESIDGSAPVQGAELVRGGLEKVFSSGGPEISYRRLENVGLGYIKDVSTATKVALQVARELASKHGYVDDESGEKFVKSTGMVKEDGEKSDYESSAYENGALPMAGTRHEKSQSPEEKREVEIGKEILKALENMNVASTSGGLADDIRKLAVELIQMHGGK